MCLCCGARMCVDVMAAVRVVVHVAPGVEAASVVTVITVIFVVPVVVIDGPPWFWRDARAFCCCGPKAGTADPVSPNSATGFPCCLIPCDVIFCVSCCCCCLRLFLCASAGIDVGEGVFWDAAFFSVSQHAQAKLSSQKRLLGPCQRTTLSCRRNGKLLSSRHSRTNSCLYAPLPKLNGPFQRFV